ncbi:hypothetical protein XELAEV_18025986mg [Xenopus laevis]|uniref:Uncharacterized protein n=1 Tax=Xenopus laevis TaxID=8355 RepID=A0A974D0L6_XENLA|nr:hypothetical protein XELAEV_18025986mg [Xenopus laevis]
MENPTHDPHKPFLYVTSTNPSSSASHISLGAQKDCSNQADGIPAQTSLQPDVNYSSPVLKERVTRGTLHMPAICNSHSDTFL